MEPLFARRRGVLEPLFAHLRGVLEPLFNHRRRVYSWNPSVERCLLEAETTPSAMYLPLPPYLFDATRPIPLQGIR